MYSVEKRSNILYKSCGVHIARFLQYVWPVFNIMHERANPSSVPSSLTAKMYLEFWSSLAIQFLNTDGEGYTKINHYIVTKVRQTFFTCIVSYLFFNTEKM